MELKGARPGWKALAGESVREAEGTGLSGTLTIGREFPWPGRSGLRLQDFLVDVSDIAAWMIITGMPVKVATGGFTHQTAAARAIELSRFLLTLGHKIFSLARAGNG